MNKPTQTKPKQSKPNSPHISYAIELERVLLDANERITSADFFRLDAENSLTAARLEVADLGAQVTALKAALTEGVASLYLCGAFIRSRRIHVASEQHSTLIGEQYERMAAQLAARLR